MKALQWVGLTVVSVALLTACGGGDDSVVSSPIKDPTGEVPSSAAASVDAYTGYAIEQVKATSETAEPLGTNLITTPPTSETAEPTPVS